MTGAPVAANAKSLVTDSLKLRQTGTGSRLIDYRKKMTTNAMQTAVMVLWFRGYEF